MLRSNRIFLHATNAAISISGVIYFGMLYFLESDDEFSILNHPYQDTVRNWHIILAPFLVFAVALIFNNHIVLKIKSHYSGRGRTTGLLMCVLFPVMVLSAYLLQIASNDSMRTTFLYAHNLSSFLWIFVYLVHQTRMMRQ
ncbi:MAG: hypothetical protein H8E25_12180 [Planctomycetes bacterium]|jgi:hypothetical protein|nr:hypothetical protein [Planctomycetota bacterium]